MDQILQVEDVVKRFGGLVALNQVKMHVNRGEILGLIGPNGAGKTTLFNCVAGAHRLTSGSVLYNGENITKLPAYKRCKRGIGRTFQITKPFSSLSVLDNVCVAALFGTATQYFSLSGSALDKCRAEAEAVLDFMHMSHKKDMPAGTLNVPERKRLEICRALASKPQLLLLDEVVAGLNPSEVAGMVDLIKRVNATGVSILMIEHVMKAVMEVSDRITVLSFGELIAEGTPEEISSNEVVIEAYLGKRRHHA